MTIKKNTPASNLETSATKNKIAEGIVKLSMDTEVRKIPDELIEAAGKKAIANLFYFGLQGEASSEITVTALPISVWNDKSEPSYEREGLINALLPDQCGNNAEMTWAFPQGTTIAEAAQAMHKAGFQFNAAFQNNEDKKLTAQVKKALSGDFNEKAKPKKAPAPKKKKDNDNGGTYGGGGFGGRRGPFGGGCWGTGRGGMGW